VPASSEHDRAKPARGRRATPSSKGAAGNRPAAPFGALPDIKALSPAELRELVAELGLPAFRADQLIAWLHGRGAVSFDQMTDLGVPLREKLAARFTIGSATIDQRVESRLDGTRKYLMRFSDGQTVETVGLPVGDRLTVCFSTQAGCAMACAFCATGKQGLSRSLGAGEMVDQVRLVGEDFGMRVTNAVAMGQGEPFANYESTLTGLRFMNAPKGLGIGARHLTVSTCGLIKGIEQLAHEPEQFTLAVSLHSAVQDTRNRMVPAMRSYPVPRLRAALERYARDSGRRPTIEYAMIDGVNDTIPERDALVAFCRGMLCHVNLIPMNDTGSRSLHRSTETTVRGFANALRAAGVEVSERVERGADIGAACGQLKGMSATD
jgi:23S rRNA (adenine2503-C2)-methyltransferase